MGRRRAIGTLLLTLCLLASCSSDEVRRDPELRRELLEMRDADQAERTGQAPGGVETDRARAERLKEIIEEHGWPTIALVGRDGASAAWLIAQHADFDVVFQERALELMREALADGQADPVDVAYLEDRVAVNRGRPQTYGTQIRCMDGRPEPATPIEDEANVDARRERVGLDPLQEYYAELEEACAAEAAGGYAVLAWLFLAALVVQVFFAGLMLFGEPSGRSLHAGTGWTLHSAVVLLPVAAALGRSGLRPFLHALALAVATGIQPLLALQRETAVVAALHPVNALLMTLLAVVVARGSLRLLRERAELSA